MRCQLFIVTAFSLLATSCTSVTGTSDRDVVSTYRLFAKGKCDQLQVEIDAIDWSRESPGRRPFFELIQGYCHELSGDTDAASSLYRAVISRAPSTHQAFEASLRLEALDPKERARRDRLSALPNDQSPYAHGAKPIHRTQPTYPSALRGAQIDGWVAVDFSLKSNGSVFDPFVSQSYPPFILDGSALSAVRHWVYEPTADSRSERRNRIVLNFKIQY